MKIKGKVIQIIPPEKHESFLLPYFPHNKDSVLYGKTFVLIYSENLPNGYLKALFWRFRHRKERYWAWRVCMDKCDFKVGDVVELEANPLYTEDDRILIEKTVGDFTQVPLSGNRIIAVKRESSEDSPNSIPSESNFV